MCSPSQSAAHRSHCRCRSPRYDTWKYPVPNKPAKSRKMKNDICLVVEPPIWKICSSNWKWSPNGGENKQYLKAPVLSIAPCWCYLDIRTLLWTNISPPSRHSLEMIFLSTRWNMLVSWRVNIANTSCRTKGRPAWGSIKVGGALSNKNTHRNRQVRSIRL